MKYKFPIYFAPNIRNHKNTNNTSRIRIIGTISIAGSIKEKPDIHVAEKPKPLKPLIIDAINTVKIIKEFQLN